MGAPDALWYQNQIESLERTLSGTYRRIEELTDERNRYKGAIEQVLRDKFTPQWISEVLLKSFKEGR